MSTNITKAAIKRLAHRGGVKRLSSNVYETVNRVIKHRTESIIREAIIYADSVRRITIQEGDVAAALPGSGLPKMWKSPTKKRPERGARFSMNGGRMDVEDRAPRGRPREHRFRPGTRALMNIRKYQKTTDLLIPKLSFQRLIREIGQEYKSDLRFSEDALLLCQMAIETYLVKLFEDINLIAISDHRVTILPKDVNLALRIGRT